MPPAHIVSHNPATVSPPAGSYSLGLEVTQHRRLLFISGQVPERSDGTVPEGFEAQCEQAWRNVMEVLASAGLGVAHLVKVTTFLTDRTQVATNRTIRRKMLGRPSACADRCDRRDRRQQMAARDRGDRRGMKATFQQAHDARVQWLR